MSIHFEIYIIMNIIESSVNKIQYIYVGVYTKLHMIVIESGLYLNKESEDARVELDEDVYKDSAN